MLPPTTGAVTDAHEDGHTVRQRLGVEGTPRRDIQVTRKLESLKTVQK